MNASRYQVTVKADDETIVLDVAVEVPAEESPAYGRSSSQEEGPAVVAIPLQRQVRAALEAARPGGN